MENPDPPAAPAQLLTPRGRWVEREFFPYYEIRFETISSISIAKQMWFDELLIAIFYYDVDVLRKFSAIMNNWKVKEEAGKRDEVLELFKNKWEAKVAFSYLMGLDEDLNLQLEPHENKQAFRAFFDKIHDKYKYNKNDRLQRALSYVVEKKAVDVHDYKYVLYAFYVFRTERIHQPTLETSDFDILRYIYDIGYVAEGTSIVIMRAKRSAQILFYRHLREFVLEHHRVEGNPEGWDWSPLAALAMSRNVSFYLNQLQPIRIRHVDMGEFIQFTPELRDNGDTLFQALLGDICKVLRPKCMASLLDFKMHLLYMHSLARIVIYVGKFEEYHKGR